MKTTFSFIILLGISVQVLSLNLADIDLINPLPTARGFQVSGANANDATGFAVSYAGDVNGDGIDDFMFGTQHDARYTSNLMAKTICVIYGKEGEGPGDIDLLQDIAIDRGFKVTTSASSFTSISSAGDINGDGIDDLVFGSYEAAPFGRRSGGAIYVLYGKAGGFETNVDVNVTIDLAQGFQIYGIAGSYFGNSLSSAGDVNGDGIGDIIVGATYSSTSGREYNGAVYVIYGKEGGLDAHIDLASSLNLAQGFGISGGASYSLVGTIVSRAGDVNGDGIDDVMTSTYQYSPLGRQYGGVVYVIYGRYGGLQSHIDLNTWTLTQGFQIMGSAMGFLGYSISPAGDFNADGIDDLLVGEMRSSPFGRPYAGTSYVIYGRAGGFQSHMDLEASLSLSEGLMITGPELFTYLGSVSGYPGDINQDGIDDVIVASSSAPPIERAIAGTAYVIYGKAGGFSAHIDLNNTLDITQGFKIMGGFANDRLSISVSYADLNNDGSNDLILGAYLFDRGAYTAGSQLRQDAGAVYVIYSACPLKGCTQCKSNGLCEICESGSGYVLTSNETCEIPVPANGCASFDEYKYQNNSCIPSCPSPYRVRMENGGKYCDKPCPFGYFLHQDNTCSATCDSGFTIRLEEDVLLCDQPPEDLCTIVYQSNMMTTTCKNENNTCPAGQFQYQNGSCLSSCQVPYSAALRYGSAFCDSPCSYNERLYPDSTCSATCKAGFVEKEQNGAKFCVPLPPKDTTSVLIQTYTRYNTSISDFNAQDGSTKYIEQLATVTELDPSLITVVDVREGSAIIEAEIVLPSFSDQASVDAIKLRAQALSEKLSYAAEHNNLDVIPGVNILDYKSNIQVSMPAPCNPGTYLNLETGICDACDSSCSTCSGAGPNACSSCSILKLLTDDNSCKCPAGSVSTGPKACKVCDPGFYPNDAAGTCDVCDPSCPTCSGPGPQACLSCSAEKILVDDNSCKCPAGSVSTGPTTCVACNAGYYPDDTSGTCKKCDASCSTCSGAGPNACLSCSVQKVLSASNSCDCPAGSYSNGPTTCITCDSSSFFNQQTLKCQACDSTCATCSGSGSKACSSCKSPKVLTDDNSCGCPAGSVSIGSKICLPCNPGYYPYDPLGLCLKCDLSCATCSGAGPNACSSCSSQKTLSDNNSCECSPGYYSIGFSSCTKCDSSCKTCSGFGKRACTSCASGLTLKNGMCKNGGDGGDSDNRRFRV